MSAHSRPRSWSVVSLASSLWRKALRKPVPSPVRSRRAPRPLRGFELLEDRTVPATLDLVVTTTLDVMNPNDGVLSLREAIDAGNAAADGATIALDAETYNLALTGSGDLDVTGTVVITGAGPGATRID